MSVAKVRYIGESTEGLTHGEVYDAYCIEFLEGVRDGIVVKDNKGGQKDLNHLRDFEILSDPDNVLNTNYAVVECITHDYDDEFLAVFYGKLYKAIGRDKYGNYLIEDDEMCCYFYSSKDFEVIYDPDHLLDHTSIEYNYGGSVDDLGGPCLEVERTQPVHKLMADGETAIKFTEGNKTLLFSIENYQYRMDDLKNEDRGNYYGDANWLTIRIDFTDENGTRTYEDPSIDTVELQSIGEDIQKIIDGKETGYISEFMEPEFRIAVTKISENIYAFQVIFYYLVDKNNWEKVYISEGMDLDELKEVCDGFREMSRQFPEIKFPDEKEAD